MSMLFGCEEKTVAGPTAYFHYINVRKYSAW